MRSRRGFTLIELLLVVVILGLLAAVAIPRFAHTGSETKGRICRANVTIINSQIELWAAQHAGAYPASDDDFQQDILNNVEVFPEGPPVCPHGLAYKYDLAKKRVTHHLEAAHVAAVEAEALGEP